MNRSLAQAPMEKVALSRIWAFFLPLGLSASLVTISHVIINSTLSRAADPERIITAYAIAMSLLTITERPAVLLRQTCSALVRDKQSFKSMFTVSQIVFASITAMGLLISYTPLGVFIFQTVFGVTADRVGDVIEVYRILMFVSIFSGLRCLYHGVIISHFRTKWLTIGMVIRLAAMYALSLYFIHRGVDSSTIGAIIFLSGMIIEAAVSFLEGRLLVRKMPERLDNHHVQTKRHVFSFYRPLLFSSFISVWIGPSINAMLGKTWDAQLSISSFAIAASLVMLVSSFFSYFHQIVINFYRVDPAAVKKFTLMLGFVPALLLSMLAFTPVGLWFLENIIGVQGRLLGESVRVLQAFTLFALVMPWLDVLNGLVFVRGETRIIFWSQICNLSLTLLTLVVCIFQSPQWNGTIGAWAQSIGMLAEIMFVAFALRIIKLGPIRLRRRRS